MYMFINNYDVTKRACLKVVVVKYNDWFITKFHAIMNKSEIRKRGVA